MATHKKNLRILYWNSRSIVNKKAELSKILTELDVFICVKSWLTKKTSSTSQAIIHFVRIVKKKTEEELYYLSATTLLIRKKNIISPLSSGNGRDHDY